MNESSLPAQWLPLPIGRACEHVGTVDFQQAPFSTFRYIDISSIDNEMKVIANAREVSVAEAPSRARQIVHSGDVLVSTVRPNLNAVALVSDDLNGAICSTGFCVLRAMQELMDPEYLFAWVRHPTFIQQLVQLARGIGYPAVSDSDVKRVRIPLSPLPEQRRIVAVLREADKLQWLHRDVAGRSKQLLPALFHHAFGDVSGTHGRWPIVRVDEAGEVQLGRQRAPQYQTGRFSRPYLRVANVFEDRIDLSDVLFMDFDPSDFAKYRLEYGDILLNEGQSTELVGRPAMWRNEIEDCCFQNTLVRFRANPTTTNPDFALAVFLMYYRAGRFAAISSKTSNVAHLGALASPNCHSLCRHFLCKSSSLNKLRSYDSLSVTRRFAVGSLTSFCSLSAFRCLVASEPRLGGNSMRKS